MQSSNTKFNGDGMRLYILLFLSFALLGGIMSSQSVPAAIFTDPPRIPCIPHEQSPFISPLTECKLTALSTKLRV